MERRLRRVHFQRFQEYLTRAGIHKSRRANEVDHFGPSFQGASEGKGRGTIIERCVQAADYRWDAARCAETLSVTVSLEKPGEAGATQRHTVRTVPAAAEPGIGATNRGGRAGGSAWVGARGRERAGMWDSGARQRAWRERAGAVTCCGRGGGVVENEN
jgi:hypothetical protein